MRTPRAVALGGTIAVALVLGTACGGGSSSSDGATTGPSAATVPPGAADPNAPEVNAAGDIPDDQVFIAYTPPSGGFTVKVPEGWSRTESGGAVSFTDKLNTIRMETVARPVAPTAASVRADELPAIATAATNFEAGQVEQVARPAGDAILVTYKADSAPNDVTGKVISADVERSEFWRDGTTVVLTLSGPVGADNVDPWRIVTDSFAWTP